MSKENIVERVLEESTKCGADKVDLVIYSSKDNSVRVRLGEVETIEGSENKGLGVRVMIAGKDGYKQAIASTSDLSDSAIDDVIERAVKMAEISPVDKFINLAEKNDLIKLVPDLDLYDDYVPTADELKNIALSCEDSALSVAKIENSEGADASWGKSEITLAASNGFYQKYNTSSFSVSASVIGKDGDSMETDYDYSSSRHFDKLDDPKKIGKSAADRTIKKLGARKIKSCQVPVIYERRVARELLGSLISAVNGVSVARKTSFLHEKMGKSIFKDNINIFDDPLIKNGMGSRPFDSEGFACKKLPIIKNGILSNWLLDIRSANQLGLKSNGRATRGVCSAPSPSSSNVYLENGKVSETDIISDIKQGLYLTDTFGMGINGITGDYSQGASGFWIENGEVTYPVNEITIASNLLDMFLMLVPANDLEMKYAVNSPTLLIEKMTIAGV